MRTAVAIGAHHDDIEIGCGGTLWKLKDAGWKIIFILVTDGGNWEKKSKNVRKIEQEKSCNLLSVDRTIYLDYADGKLQVTSETIDQIFEILKEESPDIVFTHYGNDTHQDHRAVSKLTIAAGKKENILMYKSITSNEFPSNIYVDISENFESKKQLLNCFNSQIIKYNERNESLLESVYVMGRIEGIKVGKKIAEGFISVNFTLNTFILECNGHIGHRDIDRISHGFV